MHMPHTFLCESCGQPTIRIGYNEFECVNEQCEYRNKIIKLGE